MNHFVHGLRRFLIGLVCLPISSVLEAISLLMPPSNLSSFFLSPSWSLFWWAAASKQHFLQPPPGFPSLSLEGLVAGCAACCWEHVRVAGQKNQAHLFQVTEKHKVYIWQVKYWPILMLQTLKNIGLNSHNWTVLAVSVNTVTQHWEQILASICIIVTRLCHTNCR